jgi:hypothetical protein
MVFSFGETIRRQFVGFCQEPSLTVGTVPSATSLQGDPVDVMVGKQLAEVLPTEANGLSQLLLTDPAARSYSLGFKLSKPFFNVGK